MQLMEFYADMIRGSEPLRDLRKRYAANIIRTITRNRFYYPLAGESPKLDKIYTQLVEFSIKRDREKNKQQLLTLIKEIKKIG